MKPGTRVKIVAPAVDRRDRAHRESLPKSDDELRHAAHLQHRIKHGQHEGRHNRSASEKAWEVLQIKGDKVWVVMIEDGERTDYVKIVGIDDIEAVR
jgi:hypothetical protein